MWYMLWTSPFKKVSIRAMKKSRLENYQLNKIPCLKTLCLCVCVCRGKWDKQVTGLYVIFIISSMLCWINWISHNKIYTIFKARKVKVFGQFLLSSCWSFLSKLWINMDIAIWLGCKSTPTQWLIHSSQSHYSWWEFLVEARDKTA